MVPVVLATVTLEREEVNKKNSSSIHPRSLVETTSWHPKLWRLKRYRCNFQTRLHLLPVAFTSYYILMPPGLVVCRSPWLLYPVLLSFSMPFTLHQFIILLFGLFRTAFQWLMDHPPNSSCLCHCLYNSIIATIYITLLFIVPIGTAHLESKGCPEIVVADLTYNKPKEVCN